MHCKNFIDEKQTVTSARRVKGSARNVGNEIGIEFKTEKPIF